MDSALSGSRTDRERFCDIQLQAIRVVETFGDPGILTKRI